MTSSCLIGDFKIAPSAYSSDHQATVAWLSQAHAQAELSLQRDSDFDREAFQKTMHKLISRYGPGSESLAQRGHGCEDFLHLDWDRMRLFNVNKNPKGAGMAPRMELFSEIADRAVTSLYAQDMEPPDEMIHVSCTGYGSPSAVQKLVVSKGWQEKVGITHAYHMGCYASLPALRIASAFLAGPRAHRLPARVDIVHTEACTLHLDPSAHEPEQLVVQSLFADGHIRYSLRQGNPGDTGLRYLAVREEIIPGSTESMGWTLGDHGMRMTLARDVPERIAQALREFLLRLYADAEVDAKEALTKGVFAVHPGGPRIIDKVAELLELAPAQISASRAVLRDCGNMSSATLPHIWAALAADSYVAPGTLITSLAFGPGLTLYGAILRKT